MSEMPRPDHESRKFSVLKHPAKTTSTSVDLRESFNTPKDLMSVINGDLPLANKVLEAVNSGRFSLPEKVQTLNQAFVLLGFNTIRQIAISSIEGTPLELAFEQI